MKVYLTDQIHQLKSHLNDLKSKEMMSFDKTKLVDKTTEIIINTPKQLNEIDLSFFFNYEIFPANIMIFKTEWSDENREMRMNDTIVQQAFLPPNKTFSQKLVFGVRICEIINEENKKGFGYATLEGHVEKGISTFTMEEIEEKLKFRIHTFSLPGNFLTQILGSILTVPYQAYCTKQ